MEQLKKIAERIDGLSLRERAFVFIGIIAVMFSIWNAFFISPIELEQKNIIAELNKKNAERLVLNKKLQDLIAVSKQDPHAENLEKLKSLRSELIEVQAALESSTANLITPKDMPKVLETVLHKTGGLNLLRLNSLGVTPLVAKDEAEANEEQQAENQADNKNLTAENLDSAYRHGLRIEFEGDYLTTLDYLRKLEALEWNFFWDNFQFNVNEYPDATASIELFTLSLRPEWIGV